MNKPRIIGLLMIIAGIILHYSFENDGVDFAIGFLVGGGFALLIMGKAATKKQS